MRVLVVEDSRSLADVLVEGLRDQGMAVDAAHDGLEAAAKLEVNAYNVVVLDRDLPGIHGDTLCQMITERDDRVMVLMLTAASAPGERVSGLGLGADDYLAKPFALEELRARLRALLRRSGAGAGLIRFADIELDVAAHQASRRGMRLPLTKTEFALLELFLRNPGRVLSRTQIFESVWGYDFGPESNGLWVYIGYLRRKIGEPRLIQTVRGIGYVLREET
jgi:DNA-binding response OmpR family regulator